MIAAKSHKPRARTYSKHGLNTLRKSLKYSGNALTSRRYKLGRVLWEWRQELVRDVGGEAAISTQQLAVIDLAVKTKLLLDSIDAWLLTQPSLIDKRRRALLPVVRERQALADALARYMGLLGLERKTTSLDLAQALGGRGAR
jgi:hypothetical protein